MIRIPDDLKPGDGRFGCGPTRIRPEQCDALQAGPWAVLGTSHRQAPVRSLVASVRQGLRELLNVPDGHEVVLGNGGASCFWAVATCSLIESGIQHAVAGSFAERFAQQTASAPWVRTCEVRTVPHYERPTLAVTDTEVDCWAWTHHETSTGVWSPVKRLEDAAPGSLMLVDATSAAGALPVDLNESDAYYFSPQKGLGSDGGLWLAVLSPAAQERARRLTCLTDRWVPDILNLAIALNHSTRNETLNTPALATLIMMNDQIRWLLNNGGLSRAHARSCANADHVYGWAESRDYVQCYVREVEYRSPVVATLQLDATLNAEEVRATLAAAGIVDLAPHGAHGNLRIGMFPSVPLADIQALTACIDYVVERM